MSGAEVRNRRGRRAALCLSVALTGLAAVLALAGRETPSRAPAVREPAPTPAAAALPAAVVSEPRAVADTSGAPSTWYPPAVAARARRDDGVAAVPERGDPPSFDRDDWREQVAAAVGRQAVEGAPRNPGAVHTHLGVDGPADARPPSVVLSAARPGAEKFEGWDGGKFWFGPNGLVRMKETEP